MALHEEMADAIPDASLEVIENCGHLSAIERPEAVTAGLARIDCPVAPELLRISPF